MVERLAGQLNGSGRLSGTLLAPQVNGNLMLSGGEVSGAELPAWVFELDGVHSAEGSWDATSAGFVPDFRAGASAFANWFTFAVMAAFATCRISGVLR